MVNPIIYVLAGGEGTRLAPLTMHRCKPAVPFAGRYRLIDFALSNALKTKSSKIYTLTQYLSHSLNSHIHETYRNKIEILTANHAHYDGTADSIRKNLSTLETSEADHVIILSGDQLYSMDLNEMVERAKLSHCELLIATLPINEEEAKRMGVMKIGPNKEIIDFIEKPEDEESLKKFALKPHTTKKIHALDERIFLGSMGIYIFKRKVLITLLKENSGVDFGKEIIPYHLKHGSASAYIFDGYWEDIGTITSYYKANIKLLEHSLSLDLFGKECFLHPNVSNLPPSYLLNCKIERSVISDGCSIHAEEISYSLLGLKTTIGVGSILRGVITLGNISENTSTTIGKNCFLEKVIVDENAVIEDGVELSLNGLSLPDTDMGPITIKDGIIIVKQGAFVPKNFHILENREYRSA
jgi:glucose-1-phosphate adenylyltransferase